MEELVKILINQNKTISIMESCTGGGFSNALTNIPNASKIFSFGAVTYSNAYKIKIGVSENIINKYGVYSQEVAEDMAKAISIYTNSDYGIGITGKLKKIDENNLMGDDDMVHYSIYNHHNNMCYTGKIQVFKEERIDNKQDVINKIVDKMLEIINNKQ